MGQVAEQGDSGRSVSAFFDDSAVVFFRCDKSLRVVVPEPPGGTAAAGARASCRTSPGLRRQLYAAPVQVEGDVHRGAAPCLGAPHSMDGITRSLVNGKLTYPSVAGRVTASWLRNHRSWEDPDVKAVLGQKLATWFYQGALEYVPPGAPPPTVVEPKAAVAKKGPDKYRDITVAREGNKSLEPWGVVYFTARDLADALMPCAITAGHDVKDCYHISVFGGCTGELVWGWGVTGFDWVSRRYLSLCHV